MRTLTISLLVIICSAISSFSQYSVYATNERMNAETASRLYTESKKSREWWIKQDSLAQEAQKKALYQAELQEIDNLKKELDSINLESPKVVTFSDTFSYKPELTVKKVTKVTHYRHRFRKIKIDTTVNYLAEAREANKKWETNRKKRRGAKLITKKQRKDIEELLKGNNVTEAPYSW